MTTRFKAKPRKVSAQSPTLITVHPNASKTTLNGAMQALHEALPKVVIMVRQQCRIWFSLSGVITL